MTAACSKARLSGLWVSLFSRAAAYSANGPLAIPEDLVTDLEARDLRTDRHDRARDVLARNRILRLE